MNNILQRLEAFEIILPLPKPLRLGEMVIPHREYTLVRAYDAEGRAGTAYGLSRNAPVAATVRKTIAPFLEQRSLAAYDSHYKTAVNANIPLGTNGVFWRALSLADCAIHDLLAQQAGQPLCRYLGGGPRVTPTILVGGYPLPDETAVSLGDEIAYLAGFQPAGIKIGSCSAYDRDTRRLETCRRAMPDGPPLMIDLYWQASDAHALADEAQKWAPFNMGWIEDPFPFDDFENIATLAERLSYAVAVGDEQSGERHFQRLMDMGHVGVLRLDATVCGGVQSFLRICEWAQERNIPVATHVYHFLHAQLASVAPNVKWIECILPELGLESIHLLWQKNLPWDEGGLEPGVAPGVGYAWDEEAIAYYRTVAQEASEG